MKQVLFLLLLAVSVCSCESPSGQLVKQQQLVRIASQDSSKRDSLIEAAIHKIAETYPNTYRVEDSTENDESFHSVVINNDIVYGIGDQTGFQTITVVDNNEAAVRIMRQLDYNHIRYSTVKSTTNVWDLSYRNIIYVPNP